MKADDLVLLLEVARCGSLAQAGATLGINHATVSRRISTLERDLRSPVLIRTVQGCELTEFGTGLLESCELIERALADVSDRIASGPAERSLSGLVRIATTDGFGSALVAPLMAELHQINCGLQVELVTSTRLDPYGLGADIEIGVGEPLVGRPDAEPLTRYRLGLYASTEYIDHYGMPTTPEELRGHSLVYYVEPLLRVDDLDILGQFIGPHRVAVGSTSVHAQVAATRAGAGIGLLPAYLAESVPELKRVLWADVGFTPTYTAVLAPRQLRRSASTTVMQAIREMVSEKQDLLLPP
ncbi:LysR family transcriptional regulator [Dietzia maris]|uniref:LysR family transcriptional regulator n=1 Tax=Dietzia maris TaxID=37915 RepID=A0A365P6A2_9ACTN|nr:LysR family transcriptional regulator [Dietzia maris]RBA30360.1 LysR family transcriptional regulator [Dietzia maris]